jgi:hypothetical protein
VNFHLNAAILHAKMTQKIQGRHARGILFGIFRQLSAIAGNGRDPQPWLVGMAHDDFVARRVDRKA